MEALNHLAAFIADLTFDSLPVAVVERAKWVLRDTVGVIIGGMAVIALGYPRATTDIDATALVGVDELDRFLQRLAENRIIPRIEKADEFARSHHVLLMRHVPSSVDVDISLATLPFEEEAIRNRQVVEFEGIRLLVPQVEDLLIYKMVALRPQDLRDVEELLLRYLARVDLDRIRRVVEEFAGALEQPEMSEELEKLIMRAQS